MPPPRRPIPTSIITGSLGVGKTTALCNLVARKPPDEVWCCIVNEFGAVGIDAVALQSSAAAAAAGTVVVKQIAGGCMCCAQTGMLLPALAQIIRHTKPDRLLIEPSGLGHPAGLLDILQGPHLGPSLQLNAIICLVDVSTFSVEQLASNPTAWDQITIADILVGSKADAATPAAIQSFQQWAAEDLFPPKAAVLLSANGSLDMSCLEAPRSAAAAAGLLFTSQARSSRARQQQQQQQKQKQESSVSLDSAAAAAVPSPTGLAGQFNSSSALEETGQPEAQQPAASEDRQPQPGQPQRVLGQPNPAAAGGGGGAAAATGSSSGNAGSSPPQQHNSSCGWLFHESDVFDRQQLLQLLQALEPVVLRVKGVFRVGAKQWVMPAAAAALQAVLPQQLADNPSAVDGGSTSAAAELLSQTAVSASAGSVDRDHAAAAGGGASDSKGNANGTGCQLQLQEVCYRGPSMVEVIVCDQVAAVEAALLQAALTRQAVAGQQQGQQHISDGDTDGISCSTAGREASQQAGVMAGVQQLAVADSRGPDGSSARDAAGCSSKRDVWGLLEAAFVACLKPV